MVNSSSLDIFLDVSLKYAELNAVIYQADKDRIILEVALEGEFDSQQKTGFAEKIRECLSFLHKLYGKKPLFLELLFKEASNMTFLRFCRDVDSLTEEEIELFIMLLKENFPGLLLRDEGSIVTEDSFQKKIRKDLLQEITKSPSSTKFFAFREQGRVFLFNK